MRKSALWVSLSGVLLTHSAVAPAKQIDIILASLINDANTIYAVFIIPALAFAGVFMVSRGVMGLYQASSDHHSGQSVGWVSSLVAILVGGALTYVGYLAAVIAITMGA
jgi:hypothetical protein